MSGSGTNPGLTQVPQSFESAFQRHYGFVWRLLRHFGLPEEALDDATQEVFLVVYRRFSDFDGRTAFRSWLWGIARRVASTHQRGAARGRRRLALVQAPDEAPRPDELMSRQEATDMVGEFLARLTTAQRDVFMLADLEGMTAPEIAEALGIKLNTVYSRLRTARARFRKAVVRHEARTSRGHDG